MPAETPRKYHTLIDLANSLKAVINKNYTGIYWIKSEIARLNFYPKSGHCYPDLVEKSDGAIKAQIRATVWSSDYQLINSKFMQVTKEPLKEGMTVLFSAKVTFHPIHGLSLNITDIEPSFTLGEMARNRLATIEALKKEGLLERNKLLSFPLLPKRIAIISVDTSKGYSDFINIITNNQWGYHFRHTLFPALLQGDKAVASIMAQLQLIKKRVEHFDVVVIIRGGGGDVGLNCYDSYLLAREVAEHPLPVITGIGHSTNETIVEMVASQNKITPTDVAYYLIQYFHNFSVRLQEAQAKIITFAERMLPDEQKRLAESTKLFKSYTRNLLEKNKSGLQSISGNLQKGTGILLRAADRNLLEITANLKYRPIQVLKNANEQRESLIRLLSLHGQQLLKSESGRMRNAESKIRLLEPSNVLKRGYSITFHQGKPVKDIGKLKTGDIVDTQVHQGSIKSKVESLSRVKK